MATNTAAKSRKRIQTTTLCTGWSGAASVSMACPDNAGLAQHQIKVIPSAPVGDMGGSVTVWARPVDCEYYVRVGNLRLDVGEMLFRGLFDGVKLVPLTAWTAAVVAASLSSIGTTYNSSSSEGDETHWRRRYVRTRVSASVSGTAAASRSMPDHAPLSQHMVSAGGGVGSLEVLGSLNKSPFVQVAELDASGDFALFTGYYDNIMVVPNISSGSAMVDVHSIAQELMIDEIGPAPGTPMVTLDGDVDVVPDNRQMLWSVAGEIEGNGSLEIDGALVEVPDVEPSSPVNDTNIEAAVSATVTLTPNAFTTVPYAGVTTDALGEYNPVTGALTFKYAGRYLVFANAFVGGTGAGSNTVLSVFINGVEDTRLQQFYAGASGTPTIAGIAMVSVNAGDILTVQALSSAASPLVVVKSGASMLRVWRYS